MDKGEKSDGEKREVLLGVDGLLRFELRVRESYLDGKLKPWTL
jgi:hypothetical protein